MTVVIGGGTDAVAETELASPWHASDHSRIRLIAASRVPHQGQLITVAALEIVLDAGWKTYWRTPGDGLPPSFDWSSSENLKNAALQWPAPKRLVNPGGTVAFGYAGRLVLPIVVSSMDSGRPVRLRLRIDYGLCDDICIPADAELELKIPPSAGGAFRRDIAAALERVPKRQERGLHCPHRVVSVQRGAVDGRPGLLVQTAFDERAAGLDLFAERSDGIESPAPDRQPRGSPGRAHYSLDFETAQAVEELKGQTLILTAVSEQGSCEINWRVK